MNIYTRVRKTRSKRCDKRENVQRPVIFPQQYGDNVAGTCRSSVSDIHTVDVSAMLRAPDRAVRISAVIFNLHSNLELY